jgi:two-component system chemotaxis sensor kinase CheA
MATEDESFQKRLLATFKLEAEEHLKAMSSLLLQLESQASDEEHPALVETLFREAHSLKGAARAVNLNQIEAVCQALENVLAALKGNDIAPGAEFFDVLSRAMAALEDLLAAPSQNSGAAMQVAALVQALSHLQEPALEALVPAAEKAPVPPFPRQKRSKLPASKFAESTESAERDGGQTVRISTAKLGALMIQAEELLSYKFSAAHLAGDLRALHGDLAGWKKAWDKTMRDTRTLRRAAGRQGEGSRHGAKAQTMERLLEVIEREEFFAKMLEDKFARLARGAEQDRRALAAMVDNLLEEMKQALMLPFSSLLEIFPRMVRDLARDNGKEVDLAIDGETLEIDRRILEQMKDPLIHLVRNALDHGIETPAERERKGKQRRGRIAIGVMPKDGNKVELTIADDGAGINVDKVKRVALELGLISPDAAAGMSQHDAFALAFESGLSTSEILTDMSGRGLGLAIVQEKVEKLGGSIAVEPFAAGGTCFRIVLPTTLATFRGLLVTVGERQFVLPSNNVERVARVAMHVLKTAENRETIELDGEVLALVRLGAALGMVETGAGEDTGHLVVAVLASGGKRMAFAVDEVLGDQEVLVKGLGPQLVRVPNIAGATVLGPGRVVPILSVPDLLKSALKAGTIRTVENREQTERQAVRRSVLVAEDSITSRSLLKNILESAGYHVTAVVDGVDALAALRERKFDVVVSDVEMPRMDGFGLTARIRADKRLADLPVVLVTALESREHKERGVDVGADAYIVKSSFDQSNLLDVIERLI